MKRALLISVLLLPTLLLAQVTPLPTYKGSSQLSLQSVTVAGAGSIYQNKKDSYGNFGMSWSWTNVFTGAPTAAVTNLEGSVDGVPYTSAAAITSGSAVMTDNTNCPFISTDVGKEVQLGRAGAAGATLVTTISTYTNACQVTLAATASTTVTAGSYFLARWFQLDQSTTTTQEMRHVAYKPVAFIRCNLATLTGGTSPTNTCRIASF